MVVAAHNILNPRSDTLGEIGFDMVNVPGGPPGSARTRAQLRGTMITAIVRTPADDLDKAVAFLIDNRGDAAYLVAADSYNTTARLTFLGREPVLTLYSEYKDERVTELSLLKELAQDGQVRYIMISRAFQEMDREMFSWIQRNTWDVTSLAGLPAFGEMRLLELRP
ncbi:MAG: hypothetical protein IIC84_06920 [Chloroflexi bacterium]|nr:hypothetical protein [Chloroflexota bacterium]